MAIQAVHKDRILGRSGVDELPRRQGRRVPDGVIPLATGHPSSFPHLSRVFADPAGELLRGRGIAKLDARELESTLDEVCVVVDEAGNGETAAKIDDLIARSREF